MEKYLATLLASMQGPLDVASAADAITNVAIASEELKLLAVDAVLLAIITSKSAGAASTLGKLLAALVGIVQKTQRKRTGRKRRGTSAAAEEDGEPSRQALLTPELLAISLNSAAEFLAGAPADNDSLLRSAPPTITEKSRLEAAQAASEAAVDKARAEAESGLDEAELGDILAAASEAAKVAALSSASGSNPRMLSEAVDEAIRCGVFPGTVVPGAALRELLTSNGVRGVKAPAGQASAGSAAAASSSAPAPIRVQIRDALSAALSDASVVGEAAVAAANAAAASCEGATKSDKAWAFTMATLKVSFAATLHCSCFHRRRCYHEEGGLGRGKRAGARSG